MEHGKIKFILLDKVGEAAIYQDVTPEEMLTVRSEEHTSELQSH